MVEYFDDAIDTDRLSVLPEAATVSFEVVSRENSSVGLGRDSVAALVGQLQSWLARTNVPTEAHP